MSCLISLPNFLMCVLTPMFMGLPWWFSGKEFVWQCGDKGSIPQSGRCLEKEKETHSDILAWEFPWTEEPGGLQYMGSQRFRHDLGSKQQSMFISVFLALPLCSFKINVILPYEMSWVACFIRQLP